MKGVILAGGTGSRLYTLTKVANKHILPVFDKPMIYYPIETLINTRIKDIMIVSGKGHADHFLELLGSGVDCCVHFTYENFVDGDNVTIILGDNIFQNNIKEDVKSFKNGAKIFLKEVPDAHRLGLQN